MANRPLSPHLQIWRWGPAMLVSILHRVSGSGMATVGLFVLLWWLGALVSGPVYYEYFAGWMTSPLGYLVLAGLSWAFFNHLVSGLRHFVLDVGAGFEVDANNRWAAISIALGIVLTIAFWAIILLR